MYVPVLTLLLSIVALLAAGHAMLNKRDPRSTFGWMMVSITIPGLGPLIYWIFGVNRIRTRNQTWQILERDSSLSPELCNWSAPLSQASPFSQENFASLLTLSDNVTRRALLPGNQITPLYNGEQAYPVMLEAIRQAQESIYLSTYIFDSNKTGRSFIAALADANNRGVRVRVLIDALGERYSFPLARRLMRQKGIRVARFLPFSLLARGFHLNLRGHRKILTVDGRIGFTGGMNIGDRHLAEDLKRKKKVTDVHFKLEGPTVSHLEDAFAEDWSFSTGEQLPATLTPGLLLTHGNAFCRGISAGPNEDFEKLRWIINGAISCSRKSLRIMTPYFIPERPLVYAINTAVLRGVEVELFLPIDNNLPYVGWATRAYLAELLQYKVKIYYQPPPFVHSKLLIVDNVYALVGSTNLDPRSFRLNFEFNLEVYDPELVGSLCQHFDLARKISRPLTLNEIQDRSLGIKLLDAAAKLFSPFL
ncbi:cardiolipin synthase [Geopsychrobacter electrodiphilus]|uniref:cardiolipin synthase n=1 Tax=Geopsychrobacter electrodiphilus TaxID=225196 RepID=UPI00035E7099|nr:cardiolipin synthase [Geopsychrobacter electrodiphilus]